MIMDTMLQNIPQRLHEVNTLLATCRQGVFSFGEALPLSLFYRDFSDTNLLVKEAVCLVKENPGRLLDFSSSLLLETETYLSLDRTPLQAVDFESLFGEHLKPFEHRHEEAKATATGLWREYSSTSNRLWMRKNTACSMRNAVRQRRSMTKPMRTRTIYTRSGCRNATGIFACTVSSRCSLMCWWNA